MAKTGWLKRALTEAREEREVIEQFIKEKAAEAGAQAGKQVNSNTMPKGNAKTS